MRIPLGDCCTGEDRFYGDNVNEDPVVTDMVMLGQDGFHLLSVKHLGADERFRLALETQKRPPPFEAVGLVDKDLQ